MNDVVGAAPPAWRESVTERKRFPAYPTYKPSGIEWLGDIPRHWATPPLYTRYIVELGKMLDERRMTGNYSLRYLRNVDVQWDRVNTTDLPEMDIHPSERARFTVKRGDLLVCEGGEVGRAAIVTKSDEGTGYQKALHRLRPLINSEAPRFMFFTLVWAANKGVFLAEGNPNTIPHLTGEKLRRYRFPAPPAEEQRAIVNFLDRETSKIDPLITKKRELIERLKEKRQTLISQTVTRGLPPDAARAVGLNARPKMRPSGVDWLGEIPEHWQSGVLRRFASMRTGHTPSRNEPQYWEDCDIPWFTLADVWQLRQGKQIYLGETKEKISQLGLANSAAELLPAGTVIFSRTASIGFSGIMPGAMATTQDFWNWIPGPKLEPEYLLYLFRAMDQVFQALTMGSTHKTIYQPDAARLAICVPPIDEQHQIVEYISVETSRIDRLTERVEHAVERLQEYRSALVTAAVTGKIDVRGLVAA